MSDVEFVNVYMGKLKDNLVEYVTKNVMLETHLQIAGNAAKSANDELALEREAKEELIKNNEDLMDKLAEAKEELKSLEQQKKDLFFTAEQLYAEKESLTINVGDLNAEINRLKQFELSSGENEALRSQVNTLTSEIRASKSREHSMASDYAKLSKELEELKKKYETAETITPPVNTGKVTKVTTKK